MEVTKGPVNRQVDRKAVVHIYHGMLLSHKRDEVLSSVTAWMGGPSGYYGQ